MATLLKGPESEDDSGAFRVPGAPDPAGPLFSLDDWAALAKAPRRQASGQLTVQPPHSSGWSRAADALGKAWNAPNTVLGALYGGAGHLTGWARHIGGAQANPPSVHVRDNALQFVNNPFGGVGAITIGNTTTYNDDPYDPNNHSWDPPRGQPRVPVWEHEKQHTIQGQQLGPLYLPSNLAGGLAALMFDRDPKGQPDWHGPHNWNERGPQRNPPRPWP